MATGPPGQREGGGGRGLRTAVRVPSRVKSSGNINWSRIDPFVDHHTRTDEDEHGGGLEIDRLRAAEFPALFHPTRNPQGVVYLDHAGATLHARSQLARCHERLQEGLFGNPHSKGPVARCDLDRGCIPEPSRTKSILID